MRLHLAKSLGIHLSVFQDKTKVIYFLAASQQKTDSRMFPDKKTKTRSIIVFHNCVTMKVFITVISVGLNSVTLGPCFFFIYSIILQPNGVICWSNSIHLM